MKWVQTILNNLSTVGVALARYDGEQCSYRRPTTHQCVTHFLLVLFSIGFLLYCIWEQYSIFAMAIYAFDDATFILSTASFIVAWFVVPLVSCARGDRLIYTLNNLLENDTDLSRLHAIQSSVRLSYRQAKWFGRMMQYESIACCLLLSAGYTILYSFQPEAWYLYLTIGIYLYEDLCLSWLFGFYSTIMMHCVDQLSYAAHLLQEDHAHTLDERVRVFCKTYERVCRAVARSFFEYTGPVIATFCTLVMFEGSLKLYHVYDVFIRGVNEIVWTEHMLNVIECMWLCFDVKKLFIVMYISGMLQQKVEETALCTRHFDDYRLQNTRAAKQIQNFLLKNLHQKKKFSACGFFDIDNTVIYMVFSSIVTYLVILIQFKQLETDLTQAGDGYNVTSNVSTVQP
ncbi:AGAP009805-PE [Anopheles gambiae str. PEST]|uniref:Gustatory receptor n=1 Tax=Anopheles gambiae TaxID=7165 RepID=A7UV32_ANOGA|nr:AGAP009805-PE [Anopheles gambiae str. PEST]